MKTPSLKILTAMAIIPLLLSACTVVDSQWEPGSGVAATESRSLPSFDRIRLEAPVHVRVQTGPAYTADITADANLTGWFRTDVHAGILTIGMASGTQSTVVPEIVITVPELHGFTHNGGGLAEIEEDGNFPDVQLTVNGGGEIRYAGTASRLGALVNGSGRIAMEGYAVLLDADLRGDGEIRGENLLAGDADAALSGSGSIFLDLDYESVFNLDLTGSGRVEWWGSPAKLNYSLSGSGRVTEHKGLPKLMAGAKTAAGGRAGTAGLAAKRGAAADRPYDIIAKK